MLRWPHWIVPPQAIVQVFEIYLPQTVRGEYDKIFATENEQESSKCALAAALRCKCASAGIFTLCV